MVDTSSLASASIYTGIAGALTSAAGSYYSAKSQKSSLKYQAQISAINARIAELSAQSALDAGKGEAAQAGLQYGATKSRQRASLAANGVDPGVGNAAEIQASTDILKETDLNTIKANAVRAAVGYRTQSASYQADSIMKTASASGLSAGSAMFSTLLTAAGRVAGNWYALKKQGAFDSPSNATMTPLGDAPMAGMWGQ